jgi:6-phospho-beta-glucosidase
VLVDLLDEYGEQLAEEVGLPARLIAELGLLPSYYLRYFYRHDEILRAQRDGQAPRAATVAEIERELLEMYRDPALTEKPAELDRRGGAYYSEAAAGLVAALAGDTGSVHVVDIRNHGALSGLADDDVVEVPARIGAAGPEPLPQPPLAPELLGLVQHVAAYERLAAKAAVTGDPVTARKALLAHPLIGQDEIAAELVERLAATAESASSAATTTWGMP